MTIFTNMPQEIASLKAARLMMLLQNYLEGVTLPDSYLEERLIAAESMIERDLRIFMTPREIVTPSTTEAQRNALIAAGNTLEEEPGYDYDPALFQGNTWGLIQLRQRHAISVSHIGFYYPAPISLVYEIPIDWVRLDRKPGLINLVPSQTILALPLNAYILSAIGGGRNIPLMLHIRYRAGLENVRQDWPDLVSVIKRQAMLDILGDYFMPGSSSVSADGLSQSISFEAEKHQEDIDSKMTKLRSALQGIRMTVL